MDAAIIMKRTLQDGNRMDKQWLMEAFSHSRSTARLSRNCPELPGTPGWTRFHLLEVPPGI